jgi:hypothetical protein
MNNIDILVELAMEVEIFDRIDWDQLSISKEEAYRMIATRVLEQHESTPEEQREIVQLATMTKLLVENFVLNLLIEQMRNR